MVVELRIPKLTLPHIPVLLPHPLPLFMPAPTRPCLVSHHVASTPLGRGISTAIPTSSPGHDLVSRIYSGLSLPDLDPSQSLRRPTRPVLALDPSAPPSPALYRLGSYMRSPLASPAIFPMMETPGLVTPGNDDDDVSKTLPPPLDLDSLDASLRFTVDDIESLSRNTDGQQPVLEHLLSVGSGRTLSLAADAKHIYAGSQAEGGGIVVFSRDELRKVASLSHEGSVLALLLVEDRKWLVSSGSDGSVRVWSTDTLSLLMTIQPSLDSSGDIYSLAWDDRQGGTLYFGCQNTDIEWFNFDDAETISSSLTLERTNSTGRSSAAHRFFEGGPRIYQRGCGGGSTSAKVSSPLAARDDAPSSSTSQHRSHVVAPCNVIQNAHYGYIYCAITLDRNADERWLVTGSGDADVKIWECLAGGGLRLLHTFSDLPGAVLSLAVRDSLLFAGCQDGQIKVWDMETRSCVRTIIAQEADILSMTHVGSDLYTASASGQILRFNASFDCTASFEGHQSAVLGMIAIRNDESRTHQLISGGHDVWLKLWDLSQSLSSSEDSGLDDVDESALASKGINGDVMLYALAKLVAVPTVSSDEGHREDCRRGAHLLRKLLTQMGADASLLPTLEGKNPLVLAYFRANASSSSSFPRQKRVLFYGHYDVQPANEADWTTEPFELAGRNGYLYGRGVADNKGPIMAVACAAASLRDNRKLDVDVVLVIEGEEESGSAGFRETLAKHCDEIGPVDTILISNSSWIGEEDPCVVYGMRGVIYASLEVRSGNNDAHSGVDGGAVAEPMLAMVRLLSTLGAAGSASGGIQIPGFYDNIQPMSDEERAFYDDVARAVPKKNASTADTLIRKWREPTMSISNIQSSGPHSNNTVIPRTVTANVSFRLVPDQDVDTIVAAIERHCHSTFASISAQEKHDDDASLSLDVRITHRARWWLASTSSPCFQTLERAIKQVWGKTPFKIREGGSLPTIPFLEELFDAPCVHLPMGQHSSAAHLANERLRLLNLRNGKRVIEEFLMALGGGQS